MSVFLWVAACANFPLGFAACWWWVGWKVRLTKEANEGFLKRANAALENASAITENPDRWHPLKAIVEWQAESGPGRRRSVRIETLPQRPTKWSVLLVHAEEDASLTSGHEDGSLLSAATIALERCQRLEPQTGKEGVS